jgi:hypothetical protein
MPKSGKAMEFSFKSTSVTSVEAPGGGGVTHINLEGTATGFGTVLGTLSFFSDTQGATSGRTHWVGTAFLENGDEVYGSSTGVWERLGNHKWRVRGTLPTSAGAVYQTDGIVSLDGRTYKGTLQEWT